MFLNKLCAEENEIFYKYDNEVIIYVRQKKEIRKEGIKE